MELFIAKRQDIWKCLRLDLADASCSVGSFDGLLSCSVSSVNQDLAHADGFPDLK
jgi:hypothetical protein